MPTIPPRPLSLDYPELIVGIAGPIGVDVPQIAASIAAALADLGYGSTLIKLTDEMARYPITRPEFLQESRQWVGTDFFSTYMKKMTDANSLRKQYDDAAVLARIAVDSIREARSKKTT